jgi:predicted secreted hydrolase
MKPYRAGGAPPKGGAEKDSSGRLRPLSEGRPQRRTSESAGRAGASCPPRAALPPTPAAWLLAVALALLPAAALPQGYAGLDSGAAGYAPVTAPAALAFPRDHGPHPGFRIEWWYLTANLAAPDGTDYGVQWTLFRQAIAPGGERPGWESPQVWMAHAAVTSAAEHRFAERFARGGIGQAGVTAAPFDAWIDDWRLQGTAAGGDPLSRLRLTAGGDGFAYDLALAADRPPVLQGEAGFSVKSEAGQASYYYSQPAYTLSGTVTLDGRAIPVTGTAWLDREWSSQPLTEGQEGWDWFALHLDGGARVMLYRLRDADGSAYLAATWIPPDGPPVAVSRDRIVAEPAAWAEAGGRRLPVGWHLALPDHGVAVDTEPLNAQSWMGTAYAYWEGPVRVTGSHAGRGYQELVGY